MDHFTGIFRTEQNIADLRTITVGQDVGVIRVVNDELSQDLTGFPGLSPLGGKVRVDHLPGFRIGDDRRNFIASQRK